MNKTQLDVQQYLQLTLSGFENMGDAAQKTNPPVVSSPSAVPRNCDEEIEAFLRTTHRAWRTVKIPNVAFPEDSVLPLDSFIAKYRKSTQKDMLICFWRLFSPIPPDEFMITFYYHRGHFGIGKRLWFFLTSQRLILWDTKLKRHHVIFLRTCSDFSQKNAAHYIAKSSDGAEVEITNASFFFAPGKSVFNAINAACGWAMAKSGELAQPVPAGGAAGSPSEVQTPTAEPAYSPDVPSAPLRWYYAQRGASWIISLPIVVWLIVIIHAGTGAIILPGFLGIMLLGLIGFGGGYLYGFLKEPKSQSRETAAGAPRNKKPGQDGSENRS